MDKGIYKSSEEASFACWLTEAEANGLIESWKYEPPAYILTPPVKVLVEQQLKTKVKLVTKSLFNVHQYTADFQFKLTERGLKAFEGVFPKTYLSEPHSELFGIHRTVLVDTKGGFANHDGGRSFSINQKLLWYRYGVLVEKITPWIAPKKITAKRKKAVPAKGLFVDSFVPEALRWLKNRKSPTLNTKGVACRTIGEFLELSREKENGKQMELI